MKNTNPFTTPNKPIEYEVPMDVKSIEMPPLTSEVLLAKLVLESYENQRFYMPFNEEEATGDVKRRINDLLNNNQAIWKPLVAIATMILQNQNKIILTDSSELA